MRKMKNEANINGYVYSHNLQVKKTGEHSKNPGTEFITGNVNVAIDDDMMNVIPVNFGFVTEYFNKKNPDGTPKANDTYTLLKRIIDNNEVVENPAYGQSGAMRIRIQGDVEAFDFPDRESGEIVTRQRLRGGFAHTGYANDEKKASYKVDMLIKSYTEIENDDEETYGVISGFIFNYRNDFMPVKFNVRPSSGGMAYFDEQDISTSNVLLTNVWGNVVNNTVEVKAETETAFGAPVVTSTPRRFRSWDIVGAASVPYDFGDEDCMTMEDVKIGVTAREDKLAKMKVDYENRQNSFSPAVAPASEVAISQEDDEDFVF